MNEEKKCCFYSGPVDVYEELVEKQHGDQEEDWLLGLVAFAVVEEIKVEWIKHQTVINGVAPTDDEIRNWYKQQPQGVLLRARDTAKIRLSDYGANAISEYEAEHRREIEEGIILQEIRDTKKFLPQF